ncbi:MAG TPA: cysteine desulfurase [Clostridiaceae bacterium]|nr:cysteine desulfurase [Clostridiaceae bacterium]
MEVYLDNSATTRPYDEVIEYMNEINKYMYGNPSSLHTKGIEAEKLIKKARETISESLGVSSKEVYFTSGGTESINLAIRGYLEANPRLGNHIVTTKIEHPATLEVCKYLEEKGYKVDYIGVDEKGVVRLKELEEKINDKTALISVMMVNNETGSIQPVDEIAAIRNARNRDAVMHVDAVQAYGKMQVLPYKQGIDMLSVSSHKIHGPKGTGALYVNRKLRIKPIIFGGGQESSLRSGTENVPGICGFGLAVEKTFEKIEENRLKVEKLRSLLCDMLKKEGFEEYKINSPDNGSPYILNISFPNVKAEVLLHHLEEKKIFVSTGSACSSRKRKLSHVLEAMSLRTCDIEGAVRFSFSSFNTEEDIIYTVDALKEILPKIRIRHGGKR